MSENILSEITNWLKGIIKAGDVEGHEFHGNQYSQGGGSAGGGIKVDVPPSREVDTHRYATGNRQAAGSPPTPPHEFSGNQYPKGGGNNPSPALKPPVEPGVKGEWQKFHEDATKFHQDEAAASRAKGDTASADKHKEAADAHANAWQAHTTELYPDAKTVSERATRLTREVTNPNDIPKTHEGPGPFKGNQYHPDGTEAPPRQMNSTATELYPELKKPDAFAEKHPFLQQVGEELRDIPHQMAEGFRGFGQEFGEAAFQTGRYAKSADVEAYLIERFLKAESDPDPDCETCDGTGKIKGGHVDCPDCVQVKKDANESLADILRHDEGHDKWHAMHGDEPCKSEADCARMRAKYAEVKAEAAVAKGDTEGHEFHGNQYSSGHAATDLQTLATRAETAPVPSRVSTGRDVLGKVWHRDNAGYGYKVGERIGESNKAIASHAREVAERIAANPEKPVAEHISDIRVMAQSRRDDAIRHMMGDSFTAASMNERAAERLDGMADHLRGRMAEATAGIGQANDSATQRDSVGSYGLPLGDSHLAAHSASQEAVLESNNGSSRELVGIQHMAAADYHRQAMEETDDPALIALHQNAADAHDRAEAAHAVGDPDREPSPEMKEATAVAAAMTNAALNHKPTDKIGDAGVSEAVAVRRNDVPYRAPLVPSQAPEGIHAVSGHRDHGQVVIHVDGNVNPVTGKSSGGSKQAGTFSNTKSYAIVQGRRPGGTVFTRMVQCDRAWRIGDTMRFIDGDSYKEKGPGTVIGITDPKNGAYYGTVPNRPLSHNSVY